MTFATFTHHRTDRRMTIRASSRAKIRLKVSNWPVKGLWQGVLEVALPRCYPCGHLKLDISYYVLSDIRAMWHSVCDTRLAHYFLSCWRWQINSSETWPFCESHPDTFRWILSTLMINTPVFLSASLDVILVAEHFVPSFSVPLWRRVSLSPSTDSQVSSSRRVNQTQALFVLWVSILIKAAWLAPSLCRSAPLDHVGFIAFLSPVAP